MMKSGRKDGPPRSGGIVFDPGTAWHHTSAERQMEYLAGLIRRNARGSRHIALALLAQGHSLNSLVKALNRELSQH